MRKRGPTDHEKELESLLVTGKAVSHLDLSHSFLGLSAAAPSYAPTQSG